MAGHETRNRSQRTARGERAYQDGLAADRRSQNQGFTAKYGTGDCHLCGAPIREGDRLRSWNRAKKQYVHASCCENLA